MRLNTCLRIPPVTSVSLRNVFLHIPFVKLNNEYRKAYLYFKSAAEPGCCAGMLDSVRVQIHVTVAE